MRKLTLLLLVLASSVSGFSQSGIYGSEGYLIGTAAEIGISGAGGYEGSDITLGQPPTPIHFRSNSATLFGFVADPTFSGWVNFDGDFFTPGSPENGWGLEVGGSAGTKYNNNRSGGINAITGAVSNYVDNAGCMSIDWSGSVASSGYDLTVDITYNLKQNDLYYTTEVTITNNGGAMIDSLFYYRNVDPDNNVELSGDYSTTNTIQANPPSACNMAHVTAEQTAPWNSYLGFAAIGPNFRVSYGGFSNRDASNIWYGNAGLGLVGTVGSSNFADEAISLAYLIENLAPGASETFKFVVILNAAGANAAFDQLFELDYTGASTGSTCVPVADTTYVVPGAIGACDDSVLLEITGTAVGDFTWSWSPATGLSSTTGTQVWCFPSTTTTYTITGTSISGCYPAPIIKEIHVIAAPVPNPSVDPAGPFCPGDPVHTMTASDPGGTWSATCGTCIDSTSGDFDPGPLTGGSYWVYYQFGVTPGCFVMDSTEVIVGGSSAIAIDPAGPFCDGPALYQMTANIAGGTWSADCGACIDAAGQFDPSVPGIGQYEIYYTVAGACGGADTILVDVTNTLDATIAGSPGPLCDVSGIESYTGATSGGTWSATCAGCIDPATGDFDPTAAGVGNWDIYYTFTGACSAADTMTVSVVSGPDATITPAGPFCDTDPVQTLTAATGGGDWTATCGACIDLATGDFNPATAGPGNHDITYTINGTCTSVGTTTIMVDSVVLDNVVTVDPLCFGSCDGSLTVNAANASGISIDGGLTFQPSATFTSQCAGTYNIVVESATGCQETGTADLIDPAQLTLSVTTVDAVCSGNCDGSATAVAGGGTVAAPGAYTYTWSSAIAGTSDANATNVCAGTYDLTITDDNGCTADSIGFIVGELAPLDPGVNVEIDENCFESCDGQIEVTGTTGVSFTITGLGVNETNATGIFGGLCAGNYDLLIEDINGCQATSTAVLVAPAQVVADFTFGPQPISFVEPEIVFMNQSLNATSYGWSFGPNVATDTSNDENPVIYFPDTEPGTYQACLTAYNANGCDSTICKTVVIDPEFIIYAPNAFTPDGDGFNDTWMPVISGAEADDYEVLIFNRWGELVWSSETLGVAWDGTTKGTTNNMAKTDVYVWRIRAKDIMLGEKHDYKGHVTVLR